VDPLGKDAVLGAEGEEPLKGGARRRRGKKRK